MAKDKEKQTPTPDDDMAAQRLLREADEALRHDRLKALWDEWGSTIIGMALMIVLGTTLGVSWQSWQANRQSASTALLLQAEQNPQVKEELSDHYRGIAALLSAARMVDSDNADEEALATLLAEADESGLPHQWDMLAAWGQLRLKAQQANNPEETITIATQMADMARDDDNPYGGMMMMEAGIIQGEAAQYETAITLLEEAATTSAAHNSPAIDNRIETYKQLYETEARL